MELEDKLTCGRCGFSTDSVITWLRHKTEHVNKTAGRGCELCNTSFSRQAALHEHYRRKHQIDYDITLKAGRAKHTSEVRRHQKRVNTSNISKQSQSTVTEDTGLTSLPSQVPENESNQRLNSRRMITYPVFQTQMQNIKPENRFETDSARKEDIPDLVGSNILQETATDAPLLSSDQPVSDRSIVTGGQLVGSSSKIFVFAVQKNAENGIADSQVDHLDNRVISEGISTDSSGENSASQPKNQDRQDKNFLLTCNKEKLPDSAEITNSLKLTSSSKQIVDEPMEDEAMAGTSEEKENDLDGTAATVSSTLIPKYNAISLGNRRKLCPVKGKIPIELNMPDFYFAHCILTVGKNQGRISRDEFICLHCTEKFKSRMLICRHMRENHKDILLSGKALAPPGVENNLGTIMKMTDFIKLELSVRPPKRVRGVETQDMPGQFPCQLCDKVFGRLRYLRVHYKHHTTERLYLCSVCSKTFKTKGNLEQHLKIHQEREPYKCPECDFESKVNIAIHKHRQIHNSGSQICDVCGKGYKDKSTLTKHKRVHDSTRPFACSYPGCTWRFRTELASNAHICLHSAKRSFICEMCGYAFRQKHHLHRHEKTVHNKISVTEKQQISYTEYGAENNNGFNENEFEGLENEQTIGTEVGEDVNLTRSEENLSGVINSDQFDLDNAIQSGQLVIATTDGGYEMFDIGSNIVYQTVIPENQQYEAQSVENPQLSYEQEETVQTEIARGEP